VPVTILFDQTNDLFDPVIFDCINKYTTTLEEEQTLFDVDIFDPVVFDTDAGGFVGVSDSISKELETFRPIADTVTVDDDVNRELESFRSLSDSATVGVDSISLIIGILKTLTDDVDITDVLNRQTLTVQRT